MRRLVGRVAAATCRLRMLDNSSREVLPDQGAETLSAFVGRSQATAVWAR